MLATQLLEKPYRSYELEYVNISFNYPIQMHWDGPLLHRVQPSSYSLISCVTKYDGFVASKSRFVYVGWAGVQEEEKLEYIYLPARQLTRHFLGSFLFHAKISPSLKISRAVKNGTKHNRRWSAGWKKKCEWDERLLSSRRRMLLLVFVGIFLNKIFVIDWTASKTRRQWVRLVLRMKGAKKRKFLKLILLILPFCFIVYIIPIDFLQFHGRSRC